MKSGNTAPFQVSDISENDVSKRLTWIMFWQSDVGKGDKPQIIEHNWWNGYFIDEQMKPCYERWLCVIMMYYSKH